ncbi:Down syndrome cell adhesion molecule-like protein Dscam2 isoform X3 [Folsomia candida]|uniref:Down syndrome cell adhesion molecule-like protein Dscam2 isoform X3 n=1 Tax=Folsomia candida TaxID=158441 RepID=UPI0016051A82|nr:Down syndrome cell adhesion molecule-like protein Dscam2 isoform X3 [Folsomia candida]
MMELGCHQALFLLLFVKGFNCLYDEGPTFIEEPASRIEFINELGVRLNCSAKGRPDPSIRWTWSDGANLPEVQGLRYFSSSDGSLVFPPFAAEAFRPDLYSSTYRCVATNSVGTIVSRDVQLRAVVKESFEAHVESQQGIQSFPTVLDCVITPKYMRDYVLVTSWVRDKSFNILPGSLDSDLSDSKYHILQDGRLLIWQLSSQEALSSYQCRVLHKLTQHTIVSEPGSIFLNELEGASRPEIQFRTPSVIVKENDRVILPCIAIALPKPSFRWFKKEGSRLIPVIDDSSLEDLRSWDAQDSSSRKTSSGLIKLRHGALIITSVKVVHKGLYLCNASNSIASDFQETELIVRSPLVVNLHPENAVVDLGKNAEFTCQTSGEPQPGPVTWLKDGVTLRSGSGAGRIRFLSQNRLTITGVVREDQGIYQCFAKNDYETGQKAAHLRLGDAYPQFIYRFIEQTLQPGPAISLKCSSTGNPTPKVSWLLDGFPLPQSDRFLIGQFANVYGDVISHVNITSVRVEDGGEFTCTFTNTAGKASHTARLNIYGPPHVRPMPDILATAGQRLQIKCPVGGYPVEAITWQYNGEKIPLNDRQSVSSNGTLTIEKMERSDAGSFVCMAENKGSTSERSVNVRVMVPPRVSPFVFDEGLQEGMRTQVMCTTIAGDEPINMTWLKDSKEVQPLPSTSTNSNSKGTNHGIHVNYFSTFSTILTIPNITALHSGNYSCVVENLVGKVGHEAQLIVTVPAKWVMEPGDQSVSVGSHVAIHCQTQGYPKPTVKWRQAVGGPERKEFREVGYRTPGVLAAENGSLIISRVTEDHEGYYSCQANNGVGPGLSKLIRLIVNAAPRIRSRPQKEMVRRGETVRLRCEAEGDEPIRISWVAKGISLNDTKDPRFATIRHPASTGSGSPSISELTIRDISIDDRGDFECTAVNPFGHDSFRIYVLVQERPQVPKNFRVVEHSSRTAVLSWSQSASPADQDSNVLDYILWYKDASENWSEQTNKKSASGDKNSIVVTGLSPAANYDFRLFARNQLGMSDASEILQITTDGEPPGGPPLHISVEAMSSTEVRVSWQAPAKEYRHGRILGYNIGLRKARDENESHNWTKKGTTQESSASTSLLSANLAGLDKFTEYEVVISAFNEQGQGPPTQSFMVTTLEDVPSAPAAAVSCSSPTAHSVAVSWQPLSRKHANGVIVSYLVVLEQVEEDGEFWSGSGGPPTELESRVTNQATAFHGLSPYTNYSIQVAAATSVGDGILSESIFCRTLETVPDAPADIKVLGSSGDSFVISWLPPKTANGPLTKYHLYLRLVEEGSGREIRTLKRTVPSSTSSYEVTELKRRDAYEIWITGENRLGEGGQTSVVKYGSNAAATTTVTTNGNIPAGIVSFGRSITVPWKTEISLGCITVGSPKPIVTWKKKETKTIDPSSNSKYEISPKDLRIKNLQKTDAMNYTCLARNPSQSQHIVYTLHVQVPPTAPLLHPTLVTATSVRLQWKQGDNGGSSVRGFILNFRTLEGEWEEITLSRKLSTFQVGHLKCGQVYEFFLSAFNKIGSGDQSQPVKVTTKGSRPLIPNGYQFLEPNAMSIRINLASWDPPDCPVSLFIIEYKVKSSSSSWSILRHEVGDQEGGRAASVDNKVIQINELTPETEFQLRMRAVNGAGSTTAEYEISTSVFKGGLRSSSSSGGGGGGPSSSSSSSDNGGGAGREDDDHHHHQRPFYQDLHIILPLIIASFAIISATGMVVLWLRKKKISEGMMESTNSLAFRRDPHITFGGGRGGIDYMGERDYTVIRAKLMPDCNDYVPESADDIYPYATFHLPEKENLAENIREGFLEPPSSQRLSNAGETIPIRQIPRGGGQVSGPQQHPMQHLAQQQMRRKSRSSLQGGGGGRGGGGGGESEAGESDEYDDSCGSDSEAALGDAGLMNDNNTTSSRLKLTSSGGGGGLLYATNGRGNMFRNNDETLLVSDRKSLPRGGRSKFLYGYSSNHPRVLSGVYGPSTTTMDRHGGDCDLIQQQGGGSKTATTSFIYGPPPPSSQHHLDLDMELNQIQMPVECDNRINNGGRNILGTGRFMTNFQTGPPQVLGLFGGNPISSKMSNSVLVSTNNAGKVAANNVAPQQQEQQQNPGNVHSDYTIAV